MLYNAYNGSVRVGNSEMDYVSFGNGNKNLITNPHFKWGFEYRPQGLCYCSPERRVSQAYVTCRR